MVLLLRFLRRMVVFLHMVVVFLHMVLMFHLVVPQAQ
jgi:hypothetical protein